MISVLAHKITAWLIKARAIDDSEEELYGYAVICLLTTLIPLGVIILIGLIMNIMVELLLLMLPFLLLRKFCGGLHMPTIGSCFVTSGILIGSSVFVISRIITSIELVLAAMIAGIIVISISPIENNNSYLDTLDRKYLKKITAGMVMVIICIMFLMYFIPFTHAYVKWIAGGILLTLLMQVLSIFSRQSR